MKSSIMFSLIHKSKTYEEYVAMLSKMKAG